MPPEKAGLNKIMPTWAWFVLVGVSIPIASVIGKALHPEASKPTTPYALTPAANAYLCSLTAYREWKLDQVDEEDGDEFDHKASRDRIMATPDAVLDQERLGGLAFTRKTFREGGVSDDICPARSDTPETATVPPVVVPVIPPTFKDKPCSEDCSGHEAGYSWAEEHAISDGTACDDAGEHYDSPSFAEGCRSYVEEH